MTLDGDYTIEDVLTYTPQRIEPQAGLHGNYVHRETSKVLTSSYLQGDVTAVTKTFDWSAGVDGVTVSGGTGAGNIDSILGLNDCYRFYASNATSQHYFSIPATFGPKIDVYLLLYLPANTNANGVVVTVGDVSGAAVNYTPTLISGWNAITIRGVYARSTGRISLFLSADGVVSFTGAGVVTDDLIYLQQCIIVPSGSAARRIFRNPKSGLYEVCALIDENPISTDAGFTVVERVFAPNLADITHGSTLRLNKYDWNGLKSGTSYGVTHDDKFASIYSSRTAVSAVGSLDEVEIIDNPDVVASVSGTIDIDGTTSDLTQGADDIETDLASAGVTAVSKASTTLRIYATTSGKTISISGVTSGDTYTITKTADYWDIEFIKSRAIVSGTLNISKDDRSDYTSDFSAGTDGWSESEAYATLTGNVDGVSDGTTTKNNCLRFTATNPPSSFTFSVVKSGDPIGVKVTITYYIPSSNTRLTYFNTESSDFQNRFSATGEWTTETAYLSSTGYLYFPAVVGTYSESIYIASIVAEGVSQIDLTADPTTYDSGVGGILSIARDGNSYLINCLSPSSFSWWLTGADANITHKITVDATASTVLVDFTDTRAAAQSYTNPTSLRSFTITSHGMSAGDYVAFFNGDALVATSKVAKVIDANTIQVDVQDVPGATFTATHIGSKSGRADYSLAANLAHAQVTKSFYIPNFTAGITTSADIPAVQGGDAPESQLDAIVAGDTWIQVADSELSQPFANLYMREVVETKVADSFRTI